MKQINKQTIIKLLTNILAKKERYKIFYNLHSLVHQNRQAINKSSVKITQITKNKLK